MEINVCGEYRPCLVAGRKALFHRWADRAELRGPSALGTPGGQLCLLLGVVEYEDGQVSEVYPDKIRFLDNKLAGYDFTEKEGAGNAAD
jgi:hypothetical protein